LRPLQPLEFRAGQYVSIECRYQPRLWRVYSMANAPRKDGTMEFHVRAVGAGWVSSALVRRLKVGDMIKLAAPMGSLTLERKSTRDIVCVAGGTGLAPVKALVEAGGGTLANVVKVNTYVTDVRYRPEFRAIREEFFGPKGLASTMVEVRALAHPDYLIEVEAIAVI